MKTAVCNKGCEAVSDLQMLPGQDFFHGSLHGCKLSEEKAELVLEGRFSPAV